MSASTPKGPDAPAWTRRGDDSPRSWGREREPGAAFRGISRGRGRGSGAPRGKQGGRGAGGRSVSTRPVPDERSTPPPMPEKAGTVGGTGTKNSVPPKGQEFPKVPSRPSLAVDGQMLQTSESLSPVSPNKPTRRRRNTHKRSMSTVLPKPIPTALTDGLPISPSTPLIPSLKDSKDTPPHIEKGMNPNARVHDLRQDITSLVDHVRSMAMENKRPNSPATHIDWAGDDDDSLPDLDDWGVSSKLTSDVGETSSKPAIETLAPASISEKAEAGGQTITQIVAVDGGQSSAESPTESSMSMSLSVPPPVRRVRERRRGGGRRVKEKQGAQLNGSNDTSAPLTSTPKKSLLERITMPVHPEPPALTEKPSVVSSVPDQVISGTMSEPSLPHRVSLPPKPSNLPKKPPLPNKDSGSWRKGPPERSPPKESKPPPVPPVVSAETATSTTVDKESSDSLEEPTGDTAPTEQKVDPAPVTNRSTFDWSEEPVSFEPSLNPPTEPSIGIDVAEPATPLPPSSAATQLQPPTPPPTTTTSSLAPDNNTDTKSDVSANPRFLRSQRPLSGDATPTPRAGRERSPYKTHNPRNYSAPSAGPGHGHGHEVGGRTGSPVGRTRPPHASRPVIRMDALAMISRSLRDSTPPRRESPPATKVVD